MLGTRNHTYFFVSAQSLDHSVLFADVAKMSQKSGETVSLGKGSSQDGVLFLRILNLCEG